MKTENNQMAGYLVTPELKFFFHHETHDKLHPNYPPS